MTSADPIERRSTRPPLAALSATLLADESADAGREAASPPEVGDLIGVGEAVVPARVLLAGGGASFLAILAAVNFLDYADSNALAVLAPDIQRSLGLSDAGLGVVAGLGSAVFVLVAIPIGFLADRRRRTTIAGVCALVASIAIGLTGAVRTVWQLVVIRLATGVGKSAILPVHSSLITDRFPVGARARAFSVHNLAVPAAAVLAPLTAGGVATIAGGPTGWRWPFVVIAAATLVAGLAVFGLQEPHRGGAERVAVLGDTDSAPPGDLPAASAEIPVSFAAATARLGRIQTLRWLVLAVGMLGFSLIAVPTFLNVLLRDRYGLGAFDRGAVIAITELGSLVGILGGGAAFDRLFRIDPRRAILVVGASVAGFSVLFPIALYLPGLVPVLVGIAVAKCLGALGSVPVYAIVGAVAPSRLRALGFAVLGLSIFLLGGVFGGAITGVISDAHGPRLALAAVTLPTGLLAAAFVAYGARFVPADLALVVDELREEADEKHRIGAEGARVPALQVRNLDVSYGPLRVLFGVNIDVWPGEVLAILGTNGAGKSTLLRAISGLNGADRGVIRLHGRAMTFADAPTRVQLGVVQVAGGRAIFPSLSVLENLLVGCHGFAWDRDLVRARIAHVVGLFPRVGERLRQPAGSLSGGEQQMLALAKALLLDPQILLIDELSLGLAPTVVQELLAVVQQLKDAGTTIVIVEQSVNVALSIADRAVWMEKGQVRFEGPATDLLERDDLVRAVFLGNAGGHRSPVGRNP
ncbi:MAG: hypothetical protein NVSMB12_00870 [Acidimicrobiales bacterium]